MLSIENPPPESDPPPPCPLKKKKLVNSDLCSSTSLSSSSSFDRHRHQSHIHPHNSGNNVNPSQTPNFCIRDYVFAVRRKDVYRNWPFSSENLQLCLKHGVKQPLPPFHSLGSVKDKSLKPCPADIASDVAIKSDDPPTTQKLAVISEKIKPYSEDAFPSTATSARQSEVQCLESYPVLRSKTENTNRPTSKKCRLVVKFGNLSAEDVASNLTAATSELMASSKTCPVCKTFSSSSNTTLNAHIDQCLALGSKPVSASGSRVVRHKIKPRKIRLMTDIYATGKECTLEELDRRNGTSWAAMGSNSPVSEGGQRQRATLDCSRDSAGDQDNVYVDANGTKVRILSKLVNDGAMAEKSVKGRKLFSAKKKSSKGKRKHKYLKLVPQSTKLLPKKKAHSSQVQAEPEGYSNQKPIKLVSQPGSSRQWMPLKFTTVRKEPSKRGCRKNSSSENNEPSSFGRRGKVEKVTHVSGIKVGHAERSLLPMKRNTDSMSRSSENDRSYISPSGRRKICSSAGFGKDVKDSPQIGSRTLEVLSPGKKVSIRHQFASENKLSAGKTRFSFKRLRSRVSDGSDDELVGREHSTDSMQNGSEDRHQINDSSFGTSGPLSREEQLGSDSPRMVSQFLHRDNGETADSSPRVLDHFDDETDRCGWDDSSSDNDSDSESDKKDDDVLEDDLDCQGITRERAISGSLSKFLGTEFGRRSHSGTPFASSVDQYIRHSSEPSFLGGQEEYSTHDDAISEKATCLHRDLDFEIAQGSSFPEVEPIPIPGPPGSFLPSPRDMMMTSEDFPGQSSLTTSPVLSSEDHRDFIDRVSSDSPLSMASTVSNSRPDHMKYFEQFSSAGMNPDSAASSLRSGVDTERKLEAENLSLNDFAIEKSSLGFRNENQPCCCQRKERSLPSQGFISLNFQESLLLKRRTMASAERQTGFLPDMNHAGSRSQLSASGKPCTALDSVPDMPVKTLSGIDGTAIIPSGSNPVLRLMGKNLMVMNTAEEPSTQLNHGGFNPKPPVHLAASSFLHTSAPRGSFMLDCDSFSSRAAAGTFQSRYSAPFSLFNPQDSSSAHCEALNPKNPDHFGFPSS
ncbi:PREDICTED: uncharacterized protein LOC104822683 [Tarenaya hassleriana]|uniref:uncharacterized protein LOC104822683 n=1 Tax=Tarenaya hassleriana TaxID=28532 RepID=UPI00053C5019|nr:PREDICTED: uncharacterized protein LOC104822683 [Tarenaya hassleriana]XP_010552287.1 PREDICTED: uncharacterized protein LOC104822683 [Tarenaya hassleriana]XP_010552288.1 PREDICTED: uncharacterized protein LOC104822683 [Tarenaya hassleriana]